MQNYYVYNGQMILKSKTCLALATLTALLHHNISGEQRVSAATLVQRYQLAPRVLEPVLRELAKAGFVRGERGGRGGYEVIAPDMLSVADVVRALESTGLPDQPLHAFQPVLASALQPARHTLMDHLERVTIADLARQATQEGIDTDLEPLLNFII